MKSERSFLVRFIAGIWHFIDGARKVVLNLVFLAILYLFVMAWVDSGESLIVQPDTALVLQPHGQVVEQYSGTPLDRALEQATNGARNETRLRDLVRAVRLAKDDARITRLVIDPNHLWRIGLASLQELEAAVTDFKSSGKPVVALADSLSQQQYYLAALADEIWLNPRGMVWIDGFSVYRQYYREGLDKLEVEVNLFRAGEYKSAMEPFIRENMSPQAKEANLYWVGDLWQQYLETVSRHRGIPLEDLTRAINRFADGVEESGGDLARHALELGLVDRLVDRPQVNNELAQLGAPDTGGAGFRQIETSDYLHFTDLQVGGERAAKVAIVVAEGDIVRGYQPPGMVGAMTLGERLRDVAEDNSVKAVVLRIDSPGGDVFAAENIRREVQALKEGGKTVVVSMGDVAASGGYWIAMAAQEVWALPTTITGSIGVYGVLPTFSKPLKKLGIDTDGVGTAPLAGKLRLDRPLDPDLRRIFSRATEASYEDFLEVVADSRGKTVQEIDEVARGRVWSGNQAMKRELIDQVGTLHDAVDAAARIAGLGEDYTVEYREEKMSTFEAMLIEMTGGVMARLGWAPSAAVAWRSTLVEDLLADFRVLTSSAGGFSVAAHCLCRVD